MDMKHLGESATYEDSWAEAAKADEPKADEPKAEAPKDDMPDMPEAKADDTPAADPAPAVEDEAKKAADEFAEGFGMELPKSEPKAEKPAPTTFAEAFAAARKDMLKGGPKTFNWQGKSYGTALASDKPAAKAAAKPAASKAAPAATDTGDETARMAARAPKGESKADAPKPASSLKDRLREPNPNINDIPALARGAAEGIKGADASMKERVRGSTGANDVPAKVVNAVKNAPADAEAAGGWNNWMSDLTGLPRGAGAPKVAKN